jgi:hypothetical protein
MTGTKRLQGECQHCGGSLDFPAARIGLTGKCPHCARETELMLAAPPQEPWVPRRVLVWTVVTVLLMMAALIAFLTGFNHLARRAAEKKQKPAAPAHGDSNTPAKRSPNPKNR